MNTFLYEDIAVGQEASFAVELTEDKLRMFRAITGDENPLHVDAAYAKARGFADRVVYGMLTSSYLSTLAGMYLPGEHSLIHEVEVKFVRPLCLEDGETARLHVTGKVVEKADAFRRLTLKVAITNAAGEKILRGTMKVGVTGEWERSCS
jgi:acyl dehydratase